MIFCRFRHARTCATLGLLLAVLPALAFGQSVLRRGTAADSPSLDPTISAGSLSAPIFTDLFEGLLTKTGDLKLEPGSAESWTISEDGKTYIFKLRPGLQWSDGTPLTAQDFVFAYQRVVTPSVASPMAGQYFIIRNGRDVVSGARFPSELGVRATDARTLVIELESPAPWFLEMLGNLPVAPIPEHVVNKFGRNWTRPENMVTNGPYTLAERVPQNYMKLRKNPRYRAADTVRTDEVYWYPTQDLATSLRRFRAGELDQILNFPPDDIDRLQKEIPESLHIVPSLGVYYLVINTEKEAFKDRRVRQALILALDRDAITGRLLRTGVEPALSFIGPNFTDYEGADLPAQTRPLAERQAEARKLLEAAGYGKGRPLTLEYVYDTNEENRKIAVALAAMWQAVGVRAKPVNVDFGQLNRQIRTGSFDIARWVYFPSFDDPYALLSLYTSQNSNNYAGYANPEYDRLLDESNLIRDPESRREVLRKAELLLMEDAPIIPIYYYPRRYLVSPKVQGWVTSGRGPTPSRFLYVER